jgi:hypothetical protein
MRHSILATFTAVAFCLVGSGQDRKDGRFVSENGNYAVKFPEGHTIIIRSKATPDGRKLVAVNAGEVEPLYSVVYLPIREDQLREGQKKVLDTAIEGMTRRAGIEKLDVKEITFGKDKHPGREGVFAEGTKFGRVRVVLASQILYTVAVYGTKAAVTAKEADDFFNSFELLK